MDRFFFFARAARRGGVSCVAVVIAAAVAGGASSANAGARAPSACELRLRFIDAHEIPAGTRVNGSRFGGISGMDYDERSGQWYFVSDSRSLHGAGSLFRATLTITPRGIAGFLPQAAYVLKDAKPSPPASPGEFVDAESMRVDPWRDELLIAGEGEEVRGIPPWLHRFDRAGAALGAIPLPWPAPQSGATGMRWNRSVEGITFAPGGRVLWIALEAPLLEDGPLPDSSNGADTRLARLSIPDGAASQYVYPVDSAMAFRPGEAFDSGISEILALDERRVLVLERSGTGIAGGRFRFRSRLYCADFTSATDVAARSLSGEIYRKAGKRLLLDFAGVPDLAVDNLEAMSWGPRLSRGRRSLVLASDNNFFDGLPTQVLLFEVRD